MKLNRKGQNKIKVKMFKVDEMFRFKEKLKENWNEMKIKWNEIE